MMTTQGAAAPYDVAVVGGGFAGAVALRECTAIGFRAVLLEARDRLGGRAWHEHAVLPGLDLELGCQFFQPAYPAVWREIERYQAPYVHFGGDLLPTHWALPDGTVREGGPPLGAASVALMEDLVCELRRLSSLVELDRSWGEQDQELVDLDISIDDWLVSHGAEPDLRYVVSAGLAPWLVGPDATRSLAYLLRLVAADGGIYRYLAADNVNLTEGTTPLVEKIAADGDGEVRLGRTVTGFRQHGDRVEVHTDAGLVTARAVVCAIPLARVFALDCEPPLNPLRVQASEDRRTGPSEGSKVFALVRNVPDEFWAVGPVEGFHSVAGLGRVEGGCVLVLGFGPGGSFDVSDAAQVQAELRRWFPDAVVEHSRGQDWARDPFTDGGSPFPVPGTWTTQDHVLRMPEGRIVFAGADIATVHPGFVDGAIRTGFEAATQVTRILTEGSR